MCSFSNHFWMVYFYLDLANQIRLDPLWDKLMNLNKLSWMEDASVIIIATLPSSMPKYPDLYEKLLLVFIQL